MPARQPKNGGSIDGNRRRASAGFLLARMKAAPSGQGSVAQGQMPCAIRRGSQHRADVQCWGHWHEPACRADSTPEFSPTSSRFSGNGIPISHQPNSIWPLAKSKWPNIPTGEVASRQALQSSILRMSICNRAWSALTSVASTASAWAAIIRSSGAMVMPLVSSAARSVP